MDKGLRSIVLRIQMLLRRGVNDSVVERRVFGVENAYPHFDVFCDLYQRGLWAVGVKGAEPGSLAARSAPLPLPAYYCRSNAFAEVLIPAFIRSNNSLFDEQSVLLSRPLP